MGEHNLNAISPIDGRYASKTSELNDFFSEKALMKYRLVVEIEYFISLCESGIPELKDFDATKFSSLREIYLNFSDKDAMQIKEVEEITNHDVKAVEYFLKEKFVRLDIEKYKEFIHFGLTSQDINNTAIPLSLKEMFEQVYFNSLDTLLKSLERISDEWKDISMIARTHGQAASPTKLGKEIKVFQTRIDREIKKLNSVAPLAKFSGAVGNYHAFDIAEGRINWIAFTNKFIKTFNVAQNPVTTQIEPHDWIAELLQTMTRANNICIDMSQDMWIYISNEIFKLKLNKNEVGSSTMPHKVNPIDFENAEGNFGISNSLNDYFINKLPRSRLQRDLSDSTVLRNIGMSFGYTKIGITSLQNGLQKIAPNKEFILNELDNNWEVLTEAVQTIMRYEGIDDAYEQLKNLSRGKKLDKSSYKKFVISLDISDKSKEKLLSLTPAKYIGLAKKV